MRFISQCLHCQKSRLALPEGISLSRCGGCKLAVYCSRECQKAAWPEHKATCKINQRTLSVPCIGLDDMKRLGRFAVKHASTFLEYGKRALDLRLDQTRALRDVIVVVLKRRPESTEPKTAFIVIAVTVQPVDSEFFAKEQAQNIRNQLKSEHAKYKGMDSPWGPLLGCFGVVLEDIDSGLSFVVHAMFGSNIMDVEPGSPWLEEMIYRINNGIRTELE